MSNFFDKWLIVEKVPVIRWTFMELMDIEWICLDVFFFPAVRNYRPRFEVFFCQHNFIHHLHSSDFFLQCAQRKIRDILMQFKQPQKMGAGSCSTPQGFTEMDNSTQVLNQQPRRKWGPPDLLPTPPNWRTDSDRRVHGRKDGQTDGRTRERHTDPAIDRERHKEGGIMPGCQRERLAFRGGKDD